MGISSLLTPIETINPHPPVTTSRFQTDLHTARDQRSPGTIQKTVRCDGCFLVSRLLKILILYIPNYNRKYIIPDISAWDTPILITA